MEKLLGREINDNLEIKIVTSVLSKCFKKCVINFWTDKFVNAEDECLKECSMNYYKNIETVFHTVEKLRD